MMFATQIATLIKTYATHVGRAEATVVQYAGVHGRAYDQLLSGRGTLRTAERVIAWLSANWPADLDWPADVPRPKRKAA
jgi:hypothetical protein